MSICEILANMTQVSDVARGLLFWHAIWWDLFWYESVIDFLFIRASVYRVYNKFSSQLPQQRILIADALNIWTLSFGMPYGGIHLGMNPMSTSCLSLRFSTYRAN
jgi:hypothetical protein